jgi:mannose/fructose-specific phosphotransferase system component IIA
VNQVIVAAHGGLAQALLATLETIAGQQPHVLAVGLAPGATPDDFARDLAHAAKRDQPALVLCDLRFGTPHHAALRLSAQRLDVRVLTGVNLAMLLEAALSVDIETLDALAARAQSAAQNDLDPQALARHDDAG